MGSLLTSCFKHGEDSDSSDNESQGHESSEQKRVVADAKEQVHSPTQQVISMESDSNPPNTAVPPSMGRVQTSSVAAPILSSSSTQQGIPSLESQSKPFIPVAQNPMKPALKKPARRYNYMCEFLFDVKAVRCSVNSYYL